MTLDAAALRGLLGAVLDERVNRAEVRPILVDLARDLDRLGSLLPFGARLVAVALASQVRAVAEEIERA